MMTNRRAWLRSMAGLGFSGVCLGQNFPTWLGAAGAAEPSVADFVRLEPDLEPLVRKIEETPREKCFEMITAELHGGLTYRRFLAALFLAGVRNVNPRPPGFDLHCVFVIHAAHQLSLDAPSGDRLLPLYWALDEFKNAQASDAKKNGDWRMEPLAGSLPSGDKAWKEFHAAMGDWDTPRAERAVAALAKQAAPAEIIEAFWRYGARDFRNIGHKAIYVANVQRTLETIGWRHAEPVLRSLVIGLLDFGKDKVVNEYAFDNQSYAANLRRTDESFAKLPGDWARGEGAEAATLDVLATLRSGEVDAASKYALDVLERGKMNAASVWDALHLVAGEQMMRQPGIVGIHAVTSLNALHHAFQATTVPATRLLMLLQGVGWMCQFHNAAVARKEKRFDVDITRLEKEEPPPSTNEAVAMIFQFARREKPKAASLALVYGERGRASAAFTAAARQLIFMKTTEPHGYKYPVAIFEDFDRVSPRWRPHLLATSVYHLPGSETPDSKLMLDAREALRTLK